MAGGGGAGDIAERIPKTDAVPAAEEAVFTAIFLSAVHMAAISLSVILVTEWTGSAGALSEDWRVLHCNPTH